VDESAGNMETESQKPQNQQDYEDCPEHAYPLSHSGRTQPEIGSERPRVPSAAD
jgi:hypothetical protein